MGPTGAIIAQLLIALGPSALAVVNNLVAHWNTPMSDAEVQAALAPLSNTYTDYLNWAKDQLAATPIAVPTPPK